MHLPIWLIVGLAIGLLVLEVPTGLRGVYDATCVLILFPLLIWAAIHVEPIRGVGVCTFLGLISYPMYMLHVPVKRFAIGIAEGLLGGSLTEFAPWVGIIILAAIIAASWAVARYDYPVRTTLARLVGLRR